MKLDISAYVLLSLILAEHCFVVSTGVGAGLHRLNIQPAAVLYIVCACNAAMASAHMSRHDVAWS